MDNSYAQVALQEVDSFLQSRVHEHLKIDVDSTEYPAKDHAQRNRKRRMRNRTSKSSCYDGHFMHRINHGDSMSNLSRSDEYHGQGNFGRRNEVRNTVECVGFSVKKQPRPYVNNGGRGIGDSVECATASSSDLVQNGNKPFGLRNFSPDAVVPAVNDTSTEIPSDQVSEKKPLSVQRRRRRKKKPISHEGKNCDFASTCKPHLKKMEEKNEKFEHELKQAVEKKSVYKQKTIKVTLVGSQSAKKYPSSDPDAANYASLAISNKKDNFLGASHLPPERAPVACLRRKLLILDINGLLADIVHPAPKGCKADTKILGRAVFKRPFCKDFLKFCFERFDVGIWSSRIKKMIDRVVDYLLGDMKNKLLFLWDLSHCTGTGFKTIGHRHKELVFKDLRKIWEKHDINLPWEKGAYGESNTLLLDDSPYKALLNPIHTAIFPYSYNFKNRSDRSLGPQGDIRVYLEGLAAAEDVQKYVEEHPFGQKAIDETSSSWEFYHRVLSSRSFA